MRDHLGDAAIAAQRRARRCRASTRRRAARPARAPRRRAAGARRRRAAGRRRAAIVVGIERAVGEQLEQPGLDAGGEDLRIGEAGDQIEQRRARDVARSAGSAESARRTAGTAATASSAVAPADPAPAPSDVDWTKSCVQLCGHMIASRQLEACDAGRARGRDRSGRRRAGQRRAARRARLRRDGGRGARRRPAASCARSTVDGAPIDGGPTVFTMRDVFEEIFAACGASLDDHLTMRPATTLARHAWGDARLDLFADPAASEAAIGDFAGAARGARLSRVPRRGEAAVRRARPAVPARHQDRSDHARLADGRARLRRLSQLCAPTPRCGARSAAISPTRGCASCSGATRPIAARRRSRCPATLMLIAHVEASGVWLIEGGMHRLALALEALGRRERRALPLRRAGARDPGRARPRGRRACWPAASGSPRTAVVCNADPAAIGAGALRRGGAARDTPVAAAPPLAQRDGVDRARHGTRLPAGAPQRVLLRRLPRRVRRARRRAAGRCAQRLRLRAGPRPTMRGARPPSERLQIIVNAPRDRRRRPLHPSGDRPMHAGHAGQRFAGGAFARAGALDGADDARGLRRGCFRRRVEPFMDRPRTGGRPPSAGRAAGRGSLGSIARAGAPTPARASRWRRFPAG